MEILLVILVGLNLLLTAWLFLAFGATQKDLGKMYHMLVNLTSRNVS